MLTKQIQYCKVNALTASLATAIIHVLQIWVLDHSVLTFAWLVMILIMTSLQTTPSALLVAAVGLQRAGSEGGPKELAPKL